MRFQTSNDGTILVTATGWQCTACKASGVTAEPDPLLTAGDEAFRIAATTWARALAHSHERHGSQVAVEDAPE